MTLMGFAALLFAAGYSSLNVLAALVWRLRRTPSRGTGHRPSRF
jgi:hypothetical protein